MGWTQVPRNVKKHNSLAATGKQGVGDWIINSWQQEKGSGKGLVNANPQNIAHVSNQHAKVMQRSYGLRGDPRQNGGSRVNRRTKNEEVEIIIDLK